jgi:molybdopterin converting factor small subunit
MKITVKFHSKFRNTFQTDKTMLELPERATVRNLLEAICKSALQRKTIYAPGDVELRHDVLITKNRMFIHHMKRLETELNDGDEISILYPAGGG